MINRPDDQNQQSDEDANIQQDAAKNITAGRDVKIGNINQSADTNYDMQGSTIGNVADKNYGTMQSHSGSGDNVAGDKHVHNYPQPVEKPVWKDKIPHNIAYSGALRFVGRDAQLRQLHEKLQQSNLVSVAGMGGLGKTELAIQYCNENLESYSGGICWLFARGGEEEEERQEIWDQILYFADEQLDLQVPQEIGGKVANLKQRVDWCWRRWNREGDVLIVIDDVVSFPQIRPYLPPAKSQFKVLITTRIKIPALETLPLDVLTSESSIDLLKSEHLVGTARIEQESDIASTLCKWLEYLPLGLELVGYYMSSQPDLAISEMLFRLQQKADKVLEDPSLKRNEDDPSWSFTAEKGVAAAFDLSWDELDKEARHLGKLTSLFAPAPIPWHLVESAERKFWAEYRQGQEFKVEILENAKKDLVNYHLLQFTGEKLYRLHSLVRKFFRSKLGVRS
jgi:hypothetical protein